MTIGNVILRACLLGHAALVAAGTNAAEYTITELGKLPAAETGTYAYAVNGPGQVAGLSGHPFLWEPGNMRDLNTTLPVTPFAPARAEDVNDAGTVVGWHTAASGAVHPFRWVNGAFTDLSPSSSVAERSVAVNEAGDVLIRSAGTSYILRANGTRAFLYGFTSGSTFDPADMNDIGQVAGSALDADRTVMAARWQNGTATALGRLAGDVNSAATGISAAGHVVGFSFGPAAASNNIRPFLWSDGVMAMLPPRAPFESCIPVSVNAKGQAVGFVGTRVEGGETAALLWENGAVVDLQTVLPAGSGWFLRAARDINESGQIVGYGVFNGAYRAFLLTPVPPPPLPGDANDDGEVTMDDAALVVDFTSGLASALNTVLADVAPAPSADPRGYGDGVVDTRDAVRIIRLANGLEAP